MKSLAVGDIIQFSPDCPFTQRYLGKSCTLPDGMVLPDSRFLAGRYFLLLDRFPLYDCGGWGFHGIELESPDKIPEIFYPFTFSSNLGQQSIVNDWVSKENYTIVRSATFKLITT